MVSYCQMKQYFEAFEEYQDDFTAMMGAEAIRALMMDMDLDDEIASMREEIPNTNSETKIKKLSKRLKLLESFLIILVISLNG